jgi:hypothetical protein
MTWTELVELEPSRIVDLGAVRELRCLVAELDYGAPDVEQVRRIAQAARRARDRRWMTWAGEAFDMAHQRAGCCDCEWAAREALS